MCVCYYIFIYLKLYLCMLIFFLLFVYLFDIFFFIYHLFFYQFFFFSIWPEKSAKGEFPCISMGIKTHQSDLGYNKISGPFFLGGIVRRSGLGWSEGRFDPSPEENNRFFFFWPLEVWMGPQWLQICVFFFILSLRSSTLNTNKCRRFRRGRRRWAGRG